MLSPTQREPGRSDLHEVKSIPEPPKARGKLLHFANSPPALKAPSGLLVEDLIASNRQLHAILERVCDVCCDAIEGRDVADVDAIAAELRVAFEQSAQLKNMVDENSYTW